MNIKKSPNVNDIMSHINNLKKQHQSQTDVFENLAEKEKPN